MQGSVSVKKIAYSFASFLHIHTPIRIRLYTYIPFLS